MASATVRFYKIPRYTLASATCLRSSTSVSAHDTHLRAISTITSWALTPVEFAFGASPTLTIKYDGLVGTDPNYMLATDNTVGGRTFGYFITEIIHGPGDLKTLSLRIDGFFFVATETTSKLLLSKILPLYGTYQSVATFVSRFDLSKIDTSFNSRHRRHYASMLTDGPIETINNTYVKMGWVIVCRKSAINVATDTPVNGLFYYIVPFTASVYQLNDGGGYRTWCNYLNFPPTLLNDDNTMWVRWVPYLSETMNSITFSTPNWIFEPIMPRSTSWTGGGATTYYFLNLDQPSYTITLLTGTEIDASSYAVISGSAVSDYPLGYKQVYLSDGKSHASVQDVYQDITDRSGATQGSLVYFLDLNSMAQDYIFFEFPTSSTRDLNAMRGLDKGLRLTSYYFDLKTDAYLQWKKQNEANLAMTTTISSLSSLLTMVGGMASGNFAVGMGGLTGMISSIGNASIAIDRAKKMTDNIASGSGDLGFYKRVALGYCIPFIEITYPGYGSLRSSSAMWAKSLAPLPLFPVYERPTDLGSTALYSKFFVDSYDVAGSSTAQPTAEELADILQRGANGLTLLDI